MSNLNPVPEPTMDLQQAADFLRLGYKAMKELVDSGNVPALSLNQKHTVLLRDDLITYVREQGRKQADRRRAGKLPVTVPATTTARRRGARVALPDLDAYELTTGGRPD